MLDVGFDFDCSGYFERRCDLFTVIYDILSIKNCGFVIYSLTIYWPLTNGKRDENTALNWKAVISRYKRNGCFSLFWVYFIFFHLFRNAQAVGSSPTISSKTCVNTAFSQVFSFSEMHFKIHYATKNLTLFYQVRFCDFWR